MRGETKVRESLVGMELDRPIDDKITIQVHLAPEKSFAPDIQ